MNYSDATAFRMALEVRLNARARETGDDRSVDRLRKIVAFERLLARLNVVASEGWVIKGGLALEFRYGLRARITHDLDIGMLEQLQRSSDLFIEATLLDLDDFFTFEVQSTRIMKIQETAGIQRCSIRALLAGRRFESLTIDVGANHEDLGDAQMIDTTNLLEFAGFAPVTVPILPLEIHVAEKLHAYVRSYSEERKNTRVKDLVDLVLIASITSFELRALSTAIRRTFTERGTQTVPPRLPPPPDHWKIPYASLAREVALPQQLDQGFRAAATFLDLALGDVGNRTFIWDPKHSEWVAQA